MKLPQWPTQQFMNRDDYRANDDSLLFRTSDLASFLSEDTRAEGFRARLPVPPMLMVDRIVADVGGEADPVPHRAVFQEGRLALQQALVVIVIDFFGALFRAKTAGDALFGVHIPRMLQNGDGKIAFRSCQ